jgi:predicted transcriptional regulator of viral defense system
LVNKEIAKRLLQGKITFIDDDQIIASQLIEPSYISLRSALLFHSMIKQVPQNIECVTPRNSRFHKELGIAYHKIPPALFFGYDRLQKGDSYIFMADPEKALIDSVYLNKISKSMIPEIAENIDKNKLTKYIKRFKGRGKKKLERWLL